MKCPCGGGFCGSVQCPSYKWIACRATSHLPFFFFWLYHLHQVSFGGMDQNWRNYKHTRPLYNDYTTCIHHKRLFYSWFRLVLKPSLTTLNIKQEETLYRTLLHRTIHIYTHTYTFSRTRTQLYAYSHIATGVSIFDHFPDTDLSFSKQPVYFLYFVYRVFLSSWELICVLR